MKVVLFILSLAVFVGGMVLLGYGASASESDHLMGNLGVFAGIFACSLAFFIPFELVSKLD